MFSGFCPVDGGLGIGVHESSADKMLSPPRTTACTISNTSSIIYISAITFLSHESGVFNNEYGFFDVVFKLGYDFYYESLQLRTNNTIANIYHSHVGLRKLSEIAYDLSAALPATATIAIMAKKWKSK